MTHPAQYLRRLAAEAPKPPIRELAARVAPEGDRMDHLPELMIAIGLGVGLILFIIAAIIDIWTMGR